MIKVKLVHENAKLPYRANPTDAGADLFSVEDVLIPAGERRIVDTGIQISTDDRASGTPFTGGIRLVSNYYHRIAPRSGLAAKHGIDVFAGVVDESYRGNVKVILYNSGKEDFQVNVGDRVAQLVTEVCQIHNFEQVDDLDITSRGEDGLGSTGTR